MVLLPNYPENDSHIINQKYTLNLKNSCKSCNLIPSYNGNFKVRRCPVNNQMTLEKSIKILKSLNIKLKKPTSDIDLSSEVIVASVTEWNELYPSLLKNYPMRTIC